MNMRKILCATDLSESANRALQYAVFLARQGGSQLEVLYVDTHPVNHVDRRKVEETIFSVMQSKTKNGESPKFNLVILEEDDVVEVVGDYAEEHAVDLIAMGTHGRHGFRHFFLGSVAESVIQKFDGPVLTSRETAHVPDTISKILVPIDFSMHSGGALRYAKELAHLFDAEILLLFVAEERIVPFFSDTGIPAFTLMRMPHEMMLNAEHALVQLYENTDGPISSVNYEVVEGKPVAEIIRSAAQHQADLIIMATRGTTEKRHWPMGSVAEGVLRGASCPVITATNFGSAFAPISMRNSDSKPLPV